ncbi:MAG: DUF3769 domain-containing protein [Synechococcus sp. SB0667_bin_8]|uniref:DUF3769 domain-containing protein n=1 Tax=Synechococcus sp. SB0676_bin_10 TaxID=2604869 RepID=A0A6B1F8G2_9SYNE|nr:DUF3769 domain-containing protein [Synechococcus sp. SB0667_bin_8]MYG39069.1 DUF3769 domain-containing protein [Synechococcus sp. SB0676_bin_10]MYK06147.1 DUF3769 domain-containing protein [Synechococcus sp. SB0670_bin_20]
MADCFRFACLLVLAGIGGLGCGPASSTEILTPVHGSHARDGARAGSATWNDLNLTIRADRQYADLQQDQVVAEGNVRLHLAGGDLAAERVTYGRGTGLLTASGAVRFRRGSQYLQASFLRYNLETRKGELRDVYGVINFDHHTTDLNFSGSQVQPISEAGTVDPGAPWAELPPMACPPLLPPGAPNRPVGRATTGQQSLVPPLGCPNPDGHTRHQDPPWSSLVEDQRVQGITSNTGLQLEYRLDFEGRFRPGETEEEEEGYIHDPVIPAAFTNLEWRPELNQERGKISRWRFQAKSLFLTPEAWTSPLVVLTNDPLTPAQLILEGRDTQVREQPDGTLILTSATNRGLLDGKLSVPLLRRIALNGDGSSWAFLSDENRRDGFYVEHTLASRSLLGGELTLRPQLMLDRAVSGKTNAYPPVHDDSPEAEPTRQGISVGDLFGADVGYIRPVGPRGELRLRADLSTISPRHLASQTRAEASLLHPLTVPLLGETRATLNAAYRFRVWNGSLGEQDVYTAFGGFLERDVQLPPWGSLRSRLFWRLGLQNINTTVFDTKDLSGKTWRASGYARLTSTLPMWQGEILEDSTQALRHVPRPIRPEASLTTFLIAHSSSYGDHSGQRYYTLGVLSDVAVGHFSRPYLDYTKLSIGSSVSIVEQRSRFSFDRAVDLGLFHISWTQQLAGPLLLSTSMSYNIDRGSEKYGNRIDSIFELKWQRRAYGLGLFYSPERKLGGLQISINGFDWRGTGTPFIPYTPSSWPQDDR